jgi:hypothetical protein
MVQLLFAHVILRWLYCADAANIGEKVNHPDCFGQVLLRRRMSRYRRTLAMGPCIASFQVHILMLELCICI